MVCLSAFDCVVAAVCIFTSTCVVSSILLWRCGFRPSGLCSFFFVSMYRIEALLKPRSSDSWLVGYLLGMYGQLRTAVPKLFPPAILFLTPLPCGKVLINFFPGR